MTAPTFTEYLAHVARLNATATIVTPYSHEQWEAMSTINKVGIAIAIARSTELLDFAVARFGSAS